MAPISPGFQLAPSRKAKKQTVSTNLHRFETFKQRIAKLKIDPVHTVERRKPSNDDTDLLQSFFRTALEEWSELNLSQSFTTFFNKVNRLCENLPQLLHHADTIFTLLTEHIEKNDELALEPLLSLLAHLAHDLGHNFERYFSQTVALVARVAASHDKADVVEWCFTCLAWMFKYLAKLLVQDLRPLLDIMTPYLSSKKDYVVRFSAESLAFLLRKAAILYQKKKGPLTLAIKHLLMPLVDADESSHSHYTLGVMSLCVDSARGLDGQLHSCAASLVQCLLDTTLSVGEQSQVCSAVEGVLIGLTHETTSNTFRPVLEVVLETIRHCAASNEVNQLSFAIRLLVVLLGTRRASRISDWARVIETFQVVALSTWRLNGRTSHFTSMLATITAQIIQFAPLDQLLPFQQALLDSLAKNLSAREFFAFSTTCSELGQVRFSDLVLPKLQQYILRHWSDDEVSLSYMLERLRVENVPIGNAATTTSLACPMEYEVFVLDQLSMEKDAGNHSTMQRLSGWLRLPKNSRLQNSGNAARALQAYRDLLVDALDKTSAELELRRRILLGWGLDSYLDVASGNDPEVHRLVSSVLRTSPSTFRLPPFLHATGRLLRTSTEKQALEPRDHDHIRHVLISNLLATSSSLKKETLKLLPLLESSPAKQWVIETTVLMLEILDTPYIPSEARKIAMLLRRLPQLHRNVPAESSYQDLAPFFCLGLLTYYHDQTRKEVCSILAQMVESLSTEESIVNVALQWLQTPVESTQSQQRGEEPKNHQLSSFECSHLAQLESLSSTVFADFDSSDERLLAMVEAEHQVDALATPQNGRTLALQVLSAMPASAERRSRLLVPVFLVAPFTRGHLPPKPGSDTSASSHTLSPELDDHEWSLTDRKMLLTLFSKFVNPRVLFKSSEVLHKLTDLLSNGNDEVRKLAFQAVSQWKEPALARYSNTLLQLAEGKLDPPGIGTLLGAEGESIKPSDREIVLPVALRLVYGTIVGRTGTSGSQDARRKSILRTIFRLPQQEVSTFLDIALGKLRDVKVIGTASHLASLDQVFVPEDQQYGFLRLLLSMLETSQSYFAEHGQQVIEAVVSCIVKASPKSQASGKPLATSALSRNIRRTGFQCLVILFEHCHDIDWAMFLPVLFVDAISPRLDIFTSETTQGISGLLRLFAVWTHSNDSIGYLGEYDSRLLGVLWQSLAAPDTPILVKSFILDEILLPWTELAEESLDTQNKAESLLQTQADDILKALIVLLERTPPKSILAAISGVLPKLAPFAKSPASRKSAVRLLANMLSDDGLKLAPNVKGQLLRSIQGFLSPDEDLDEELLRQILESISPLFNYFKDESNREVLCELLERVATSNETLAEAARLCKELNAASTSRLGEVDYDRRLLAFQGIQNLDVFKFAQMLLPVVYNLLFFIRTSEDFTIRSNALESLKQMIIKGSGTESQELNDLMNRSILPVTKKCMRQESEIVRADFVAILGLLVQQNRNDQDLAELTPLLVGNDEEASFFSNVLHIQQHRRVRAIRRLASEVEKGVIGTKNLVDVFVPLLEMFVNDSSTDESANSLKGQAITAMGSLLQWLDWKHFKTLFRKYKSDINSSDEQKTASRLLSHAADALISASKARLFSSENGSEQPTTRLASALPNKSVVVAELKTQFIPKLAELIHYKDEAEMSFRLPIAVITIKLITLLPEEEIALVASPVLLDIAHVLRSRTQESRDAARKVLCEIVVLLGSGSLKFVVKELRTTLTQGYQLHVVSYTLHSILVTLSPHIKHGDLDYCVEELVPVIMDDIFGTVGQQKENQDYVSSMREVKSSKSFDSMELLARSISIPSVSKLVAPLQTLLSGTLATKQIRNIDELLRRTGMGLAQNPSGNKRDILTFSYQLIQALYEQKASKEPRKLTNDEKNRQRYLIQLSTANKGSRSQNSALLYKLARFALDLVRSTLQKHADILTPENIHGFLPVIGDALVEGQEDVKISALRLLSAIIKLPMQELENNAALYVNEAVKLVKNSTNTNEEGAQAALKLIAAVLRERRNVKVRDSDVAQLIHRITPDIEEPDRQGVTFNFIRAVMARKVEVPEVYELADKIGVMMVTNQTKGSRDVARGVYVHFLLEYPQTSSRWSKQQKFLMKNLEYEYPEGRQSVMEAINTLIGKTKGDTAQELTSTFFIPILLRIINDDNEGCRQLAGALLGRLFSLADCTQLKEMFQPLKDWAEQEEHLELRKLTLQAYSILLDADVDLKREELGQIRTSLSSSLKNLDTTDEDLWEHQFQALLLLAKLTETHPEVVLDDKQNRLWSLVWSSLSHRNRWIQSTAASLCIQFFSHCVSANRTKLPLTCDHGLSMNSEVFLQVLKASVRILRRTEGNEDLSMQVVQMLGFLGQCLDMNGLKMPVKDHGSQDEDVLDADSQEDEDTSAEENDLKPPRTKTIPALQYLLDQLTRILRIEPKTFTPSALLPKKSSLQLLTTLLPVLSLTNLPASQLHAILLPLQHMTDPTTTAPRASDPSFADTYASLVELAHGVMEVLQHKLGDAEYVKVLTEVSRIVRTRREDRRAKRAIEKVAEPERAAREKRRKGLRKKERKREIGHMHRGRRREMGMGK